MDRGITARGIDLIPCPCVKHPNIRGVCQDRGQSQEESPFHRLLLVDLGTFDPDRITYREMGGLR